MIAPCVVLSVTNTWMQQNRTRVVPIEIGRSVCACMGMTNTRPTKNGDGVDFQMFAISQKYEENKTKLSILSQIVSKWGPVEVRMLKMKQNHSSEGFIFNILTSTGCHFETV